MRIVLPDDWGRFAERFGLLPALERLGTVTVHDRPPKNRDDLLRRLSPAEMIITIRARTEFDGALLAALSNLRLLALTGTGYGHVDVAAATGLGVLVCNSPGRSAQSVAELTMALLLAAVRHVPRADQAVRRGDWANVWDTLQGRDVAGKTLGILGLGNIGPLVARMAHGFDMRLLAYSQNMTSERAAAAGATLAPLDRLLADSDVISLHLRLSPRTKGIIGARELGLMKAGALLVNTSRGELVDEGAMMAALRDGRLSAALDVFHEEPVPVGHPILGLRNVVLTPHLGPVTEETSRRWVEGAIENAAAFAAGRPVNLVNPAAQGRRPLPPRTR